MPDENVTNIFKSGSDSGLGLAALAPAAIAAMGGRHDGGSSAIGAGALGFVAGAVLGGNGNGLFGNNRNGGADGLQSSIDTNSILTQIADVKAAVPLAEAQVQLALAGAQSDITSQTLQQTIGLTSQINDAKAAGVAAANQNSLLLTTGFANTKDAVDALSTQTAVGFGAINANIERTGWQLSREISADGEKTRALISSIDRENLNRQLTIAENALAEERGNRGRDSDRHGIEINMINNQNQNQLQFQQQAQVLSTLSNGLVQALQSIHATNQAINIGGTQQANPTNTNTNVRA